VASGSTWTTLEMLLDFSSHFLPSVLILSDSDPSMTMLADEMHHSMSALSLTFVVVFEAHMATIPTGASEMGRVVPVRFLTKGYYPRR
jgi:hypothetical protein